MGALPYYGSDTGGVPSRRMNNPLVNDYDFSLSELGRGS